MDRAPSRLADLDSIVRLSSAVFDTGRRGNPKPGCDCVQCFGYCQVDRDEAMRARMAHTIPTDFVFPEQLFERMDA